MKNEQQVNSIVVDREQSPISSENNNPRSLIKTLETILLKNPVLNTIFERVADLQLPNWYVGAGCLCQTVWNFLSGRDLLADINRGKI